MSISVKQTENQAAKPTATNTSFFGGVGSAPFFQAKMTENPPRCDYACKANVITNQVMRMRESPSTFVQRTPFSTTSFAQQSEKSTSFRAPWPPDSSEHVKKAIEFLNNKEVSKKMNDAWAQSSPGTEDAKEWSGVFIERGEQDQLAVNVKPGKSAHSKPKIKGGEISKETDAVKGDFHTHPFTPEDIANVSGSYNWDGQGDGPSGGDFESLKSEQTGYFMAIESGTIRYLIVLTDAETFKQNAYQNLEKAIDDEAKKSVLNPDNAEKNPNAATPMSYPEAHLKGVLNALNQMKKDKKVEDIGVTVLKTNDLEKMIYEKVF